MTPYHSILLHSFKTWYDTNSDVWTPEEEMRSFIDYVFNHLRPNLSRCLTVLDIGAGRGDDAKYLLEKKCQVVAVDIYETKEILTLESSNPQNFVFYKNDFLTLDLNAEQFDLIIDNGCFHHQDIDDMSTYLKKIHMLLRREGVLALNIFVDPTSDKFQSLEMDDKRLVHIFDMASISIYLQNAGFKITGTKNKPRRNRQFPYDYTYIVASKK